MTRAAAAGEQARRLLLTSYHGVLSTLSVDVPGYPFGSVVPYCLDSAGRPVLLISRIAQHTKNAWANPKASLIIAPIDIDDVQTGARLTYLGNVERVALESDELPSRYYRYFPQSIDYHKTHDFDFYVIVPVRMRYIGGFGEIYWLQPDQVLQANPFTADEEASMAQHMNADHVAAMRGYCQSVGLTLSADQDPQFAGVDSEGFHLRLGQRIVYFPFAQPVTTALGVREQLVAMARAGRS